MPCEDCSKLHSRLQAWKSAAIEGEILANACDIRRSFKGWPALKILARVLRRKLAKAREMEGSETHG